MTAALSLRARVLLGAFLWTLGLFILFGRHLTRLYGRFALAHLPLRVRCAGQAIR